VRLCLVQVHQDGVDAFWHPFDDIVGL
jgi:hypothetical protein